MADRDIQLAFTIQEPSTGEDVDSTAFELQMKTGQAMLSGDNCQFRRAWIPSNESSEL